MKEQPRHIKAFEYYVSLDKRSYPQVAEKFTVSHTSVKKWAKAFNWQERLIDRCKNNAATLARKIDEKTTDRDARNIKIAEGAIGVFAKSLIGYVEHVCKCGEVIRIPIPKAKITADHFDKMVRLSRDILEGDLGKGDTVININLIGMDPAPRPVESVVVEC